MAPKNKPAAPAAEQVTLGPTVREGEHVFGVGGVNFGGDIAAVWRYVCTCAQLPATAMLCFALVHPLRHTPLAGNPA